MLWADGAVSFPAKESSEIVHAIIFNGLCGDLLNLWENVSSFVRAGCVHMELGFLECHSLSCQWLHSHYKVLDASANEAPSTLCERLGWAWNTYAVKMQQHLKVSLNPWDFKIYYRNHMLNVPNPCVSWNLYCWFQNYRWTWVGIFDFAFLSCSFWFRI